MINQEVTIKNQLGLHARASAKFVSAASKFLSSITITKDNKSVNGKSIMGVMTLSAAKGSIITLSIDGDDEDAMFSALIALIDNNFGEAE